MTDFSNIISRISDIGLDWHQNDILRNSEKNARYIDKTINDIKPPDNANKAVVVSAGPSLHHTSTLTDLANSNFQGPIIAVDGAYIKCLKAGIIPDYLLTLDPHPTRLVRWFGDPEFEENIKNDDYFSRQDLDIDFRNNSIIQNNNNIQLVDDNAHKTKLIIASTAPENVVKRTLKAGFSLFWWIPLVDNPDSEESITRQLHKITNRTPALNTGGNVGTAAWVFARFWLGIEKVATIGLDFGYVGDYPYEMTQTYPELQSLLQVKDVPSEYFPRMLNPLTKQEYYTDPTYYWYRENLLDLISNSSTTLYNCTEGGVVFGDGIQCMRLTDFLQS